MCDLQNWLCSAQARLGDLAGVDRSEILVPFLVRILVQILVCAERLAFSTKGLQQPPERARRHPGEVPEIMIEVRVI